MYFYQSSRWRKKRRHHEQGFMLSLTPLMIFIVLNFWMDICYIDYSDIYRQRRLREVWQYVAPQIEDYRSAKGCLPDSLEQFGLLFLGNEFGLASYIDTLDVFTDDFYYIHRTNGTFILLSRKNNIRYVSSIDSAAFIYYDYHQHKNILEFVRTKQNQ